LSENEQASSGTDVLDSGLDGGLDSSGFNSQSYLDATENTPQFIGRFWGIINREALPFAELFIAEIPMSRIIEKVFFDFRRLMAKKWRKANKMGKFRGATIYAWDASSQWWDALFWIYRNKLAESQPYI